MTEEITLPPGKTEADAIRHHYQTAMAGMRAFVEMGLCLLDVKARLPHGQYMPWCAKHLDGLSRPHLHRAKFIAEGLLEMANVSHCETFDELPAELVSIIDGASGYRSLTSTIQEFRHDELEEKNRLLCEERWKKDPEARDEWEPQVLSGEVTYTYAMRGMTGQELKGAPRPAANYSALLSRNLTSLPKCWEKWADLTDDAKTEALNKLPDTFAGAPRVVLDTLHRALGKQLGLFDP